MQILVVDDDEIVREMVGYTLESLGHSVVTAADGASALQALLQSNCRLVITDWLMPDMDGLELCRAIKRTAAARYVYVIILTSRQDTESLVQALDEGADDYVTKPFDPQELIVRVRAGERLLSLETRDLVIMAFARLVESRDQETGRHLERVRNYARILAGDMLALGRHPQELTPAFVNLIFETSPLHDIGKVAVPDQVLKKAGRLTPQEFELVKPHTTVGHAVLSSLLQERPEARFLQMARDIAASHHERFDGKGYPAGIKGQGIPLAGRITALADVYDALTSRRVYKPALPHAQSRAIILEGGGSQFDPEVVDAFCRTEHEFERVAELLRDDEPGGEGLF